MKPKAEFYDAVTGGPTTLEVGTVAKILNCGIGRNKLFEFLKNEGILDGRNITYQRYVDAGYFRVVETRYLLPIGDYATYSKTVVYQKGVDFIRKCLVKKGYEPKQ